MSRKTYAHQKVNKNLKHNNLHLKKIDVQLMTTTEMKEKNGGIVIWGVVGYAIYGIAVSTALSLFIIKGTRSIHSSIKDAITSDTYLQ